MEIDHIEPSASTGIGPMLAIPANAWSSSIPAWRFSNPPIDFGFPGYMALLRTSPYCHQLVVCSRNDYTQVELTFDIDLMPVQNPLYHHQSFNHPNDINCVSDTTQLVAFKYYPGPVAMGLVVLAEGLLGDDQCPLNKIACIRMLTFVVESRNPNGPLQGNMLSSREVPFDLHSRCFLLRSAVIFDGWTPETAQQITTASSTAFHEPFSMLNLQDAMPGVQQLLHPGQRPPQLDINPGRSSSLDSISSTSTSMSEASAELFISTDCSRRRRGMDDSPELSSLSPVSMLPDLSPPSSPLCPPWPPVAYMEAAAAAAAAATAAAHAALVTDSSSLPTPMTTPVLSPGSHNVDVVIVTGIDAGIQGQPQGTFVSVLTPRAPIHGPPNDHAHLFGSGAKISAVAAFPVDSQMQDCQVWLENSGRIRFVNWRTHQVYRQFDPAWRLPDAGWTAQHWSITIEAIHDPDSVLESFLVKTMSTMSSPEVDEDGSPSRRWALNLWTIGTDGLGLFECLYSRAYSAPEAQEIIAFVHAGNVLVLQHDSIEAILLHDGQEAEMEEVREDEGIDNINNDTIINNNINTNYNNSNTSKAIIPCPTVTIRTEDNPLHQQQLPTQQTLESTTMDEDNTPTVDCTCRIGYVDHHLAVTLAGGEAIEMFSLTHIVGSLFASRTRTTVTRELCPVYGTTFGSL